MQDLSESKAEPRHYRKMIILDFGSGETCQNDKDTIDRMIEGLAEVDTGKKEIVIKWQLFRTIPHLKALTYEAFDYAYMKAKGYGYQTTASVFDALTIGFLKNYHVPFFKIAAREDLYRYIPTLIEKGHNVIVSLKDIKYAEILDYYAYLCCVPEYPARIEMYESLFGGNLSVGISDHCTSFYLYKKYQPIFYESHFKLEDSIGADSGSWAKTPKQWAEIL